MNDFSIRPSAAADIDAIGRIAETTGLFPAEMLPGMIGGYIDGGKADLWLTAELAGAPIGFAFCEPERMTNGTWNLLAIGVTRERQGQTVGARLVKRLEDNLRAAGHRILLVETLGTAEFARTRAFYLANGFTEQARIPEFYDVGGDKVVFWKRI